MKISAIQLEHNDRNTKQERIENVKNIIKSIDNTNLILLPELWNTGFFSYDKYAENAETIDGETVSFLSSLARDKKIHIFTGSFVEKRNSKLYNTAVLLNPDGNIALKYSKIHLFGDERKYLTPGDEIVNGETALGNIGISICYDLRFPELYRKMSQNGAQIFLSCYALPSERIKHWQILYPARALENQAISISCGCTGINEGIKFAGHSMVINPYGEIKNEADSNSSVIHSEIDINSVIEYRNNFPVLADRRI